MSTNVLCGLEPQSVFSYFEQLTRIPRGSGNEKAVSDYIIAYAEQHGYRWERDEANNVKLYAPATSGYEIARASYYRRIWIWCAPRIRMWRLTSRRSPSTSMWRTAS